MERLVKTLVLIHAFPVDHRMWDGIVDEIAQAGWQIFTPDIRGFGTAEPWGDLTPSITQCAIDIENMLAKYGVENYVVGGCSLGGYISMELMRRNPTQIAAAILIDTKASADNEEQKVNRQRVAQTVLDSDTTEAFWRAMLPKVLGITTQGQNSDAVELTRSMMQDSKPEAVANLQLAMAARPDSFETLRNFAGSVLSIRGTEDEVTTGSDHQAMVDACHDAIHVEIAGSGHLAPVEAPAETAQVIIEFLQKIAATNC
jgi:pimeloyl-ACP methyl ester carboxylesterase